MIGNFFWSKTSENQNNNKQAINYNTKKNLHLETHLVDKYLILQKNQT